MNFEASSHSPAPLLEVEGLRTHFFTREGVVRAVDDVSLTLRRGEVVGLIGETGSGKSVTAYSIMGLLDEPGRVVGGRILFDGRDLLTQPRDAMRRLRGSRIAMIPQDPMRALDPVLRIDAQMIETVLAHEEVAREVARQRARAALVRVGMPTPDERLLAYPHELSAGMRQRVAIAMALLNHPELIIADEPTTALDVTIRDQILYEMQTLGRETGAAILWITRDPAVIAGLADRVCVMYAGRIVEEGSTEQVLHHPAHPYTRGLLDSMPSRVPRGTRLRPSAGMTPSLLALPSGCAFRERCTYAIHACVASPEMLPFGVPGGGRAVRCHNPLAMPVVSP